MSHVVVVGDHIHDVYRFCDATRLCPEAPVPVLIPQNSDSRPGGAALVVAQLEALGVLVRAHYGSLSRKERILAGHRLICRVDEDRISRLRNYTSRDRFERRVLRSLVSASALIISDYDKGTMTHSTASRFLQIAEQHHVPVFVDAKNNWRWYESGAFCFFPNEKESLFGVSLRSDLHIIRKLGAKGCKVDGDIVPTVAQAEFDVSGAGDCFLAAFVLSYLLKNDSVSEQESLRRAAVFANKVAGISVQHVGTHVVTWKEIGC